MSVLGLIVILLLLGGVLWLVNTKAPALNPTIRLLVNIVVVATAIILCLVAFGLWDQIRGVSVPKL